MDVTQSPIKINQTTPSVGEKSKLPKENEPTIAAFDQILAMFNLLGTQTPTETPAESDSAKNTISLIEQEDVNGNGTRLGSLESLLSGWIQEQQGSEQFPTGDVHELVQQIMSRMNGQKLDLPKDVIDKPAQLLDEFSTENKQVMTSLLGSELQTTSSEDDLRELKSKIESILQTGNFNSNEDQQDHTLNQSKPIMSLDKNEVFLSSVPTQNSSMLKDNQSLDNSLDSLADDATLHSETILSQNPQTNGINGRTETKPVASLPSIPVSDFAPEISEWISKNVKVTNGQTGSAEAKFSLYPEHLGHIEIKVSTQQGQVIAQIMTDTFAAKEALEGQMNQLRQALQQQGIQVQKLDVIQQQQHQVTFDSNQASLSFSQGGNGSSQEQRAYKSDQNRTKKVNEADLLEIDKELLVTSYGRSPSRSASNIDFTA